MKKTLLVIIALGLPFLTFAQRDITMEQMYLSRGLGIPSDRGGKGDVVGSEFLNENWTKAIVQTQKDEIYKDVNLKYSVVDDQLYFLGEKEVTMKFIIPIKEFSLLPNNESPKVFRNGFPKISDFNENSYYQVLADKKVVLLKKITKRIIDKREYNSAVTTKEYISNTKYFLYQDGKMTEVKKDKSFMLSYLGKKAEMESFLATNKIDLKREESLILMINHYNSL